MRTGRKWAAVQRRFGARLLYPSTAPVAWATPRGRAKPPSTKHRVARRRSAQRRHRPSAGRPAALRERKNGSGCVSKPRASVQHNLRVVLPPPAPTAARSLTTADACSFRCPRPGRGATRLPLLLRVARNRGRGIVTERRTQRLDPLRRGSALARCWSTYSAAYIVIAVVPSGAAPHCTRGAIPTWLSSWSSVTPRSCASSASRSSRRA